MKNEVRAALLLLGDMAIFIISFFVMLGIRFPGKITENIGLHFLPFSVLYLLWLLIFFIFDLYDTEASKPTITNLRQVIFAFITAMAVSIVFFYTIPFFDITPKTNLFIFWFSAMVFFVAWRRIFYNIFSSYFRRSVVFITSGENNNPHIKDFVEYISTYPQSGFYLSGKYNSMEEYSLKCQDTPQVFIITKDIWKKPENFKKLNATKSLVLDLSHAFEDILGRVPIETIDEGWFMHNIHSHQKHVYYTIKKTTGTLIAALILIITFPLLVLASFFIKIYDGGPVFYSQNRVGKNGKIFKLHKFRSMTVDAEKDGARWSSKGDNRVTSVGKVIRKLHFDEIPQMWNIVKGDIVLVGPRPERPEFVAKLEREIPFYYLRHTIAPGFTGWAQIKFRYAGSVMDSKEKFEYDLYYLKNRNFFMDLGILIRTIQIIFTH